MTYVGLRREVHILYSMQMLRCRFSESVIVMTDVYVCVCVCVCACVSELWVCMFLSLWAIILDVFKCLCTICMYAWVQLHVPRWVAK